jgi:hypothetical protein
MRNRLTLLDFPDCVAVHLVWLLVMVMDLSSACVCNILFASTFSPGTRATTIIFALSLASFAIEKLYCVFALITQYYTRLHIPGSAVFAYTHLPGAPSAKQL